MTKEQINEFSMRINQSNRTQIVVITYEIILKYLDTAKKSLNNDNIDDFVFNVKKARQFLNQLSSVLDFRYGIAKELMSIYMFANECLIASEVKRKDVNISTVISILSKLKYAFEEVSKQDTSKPLLSSEKVYEGLTYGRNAKGTVYATK